NAKNRRNLFEACALRRSPASLAGNDRIVGVFNFSNDDGLKEPLVANGFSEALEVFFVERAARLLRIRADGLDGKIENQLPFLMRECGCFGNERTQATTQTAAHVHREVPSGNAS